MDTQLNCSEQSVINYFQFQKWFINMPQKPEKLLLVPILLARKMICIGYKLNFISLILTSKP